MSLIGYARTSTTDQHIQPQVDTLKVEGCNKIFSEQRSAVDPNRPELARMLEYCREGDTVVCTKLDRIGRSTKDVLDIVNTLTAKGVAFRCLNINLDTSTPTGKLMLTMLAAIATFERELMLERQREGIRAAKAAGKYKGRKATARAKEGEVVALLSQGMTKQAVADRLGIGIASVYRIVKTAR
ncbi:recombinase family protein [Geomonas oryzae]|uniref:recombinase family protein n=1 Tax=Geomonas oryzae TaxID=2364273 RepID=UPI00100BB64A|nr:recombinase family protein [Geomonas oryzae]